VGEQIVRLRLPDGVDVETARLLKLGCTVPVKPLADGRIEVRVPSIETMEIVAFDIA
jgi:hypothetical protein